MIRHTVRLSLRMPEERDLDFVTALFARPELVAHRPGTGLSCGKREATCTRSGALAPAWIRTLGDRNGRAADRLRRRYRLKGIRRTQPFLSFAS